MTKRTIAWVGLLSLPLSVASVGCGGDDDDTNAAAGSGGEVSTNTGGAPNGTGGSGTTNTGGSMTPTTGGSGPNTTGGSGPSTTGGSGPATGGSGPTTTGGSGPTGTGGAVPSSPSAGLPQDAPLSSLTPAQATQFCEQTGAYLNDRLMPVSCMIAGAMAGAFADGDGTAACQTAYNQCMTSPAESTENDCASASDNFAGCSATVAEVDQCYVDAAAAMEESMQGVTCANAISPTDPGTGEEPQDPPSCQAVDAKCPGLGSDTSG